MFQNFQKLQSKSALYGKKIRHRLGMGKQQIARCYNYIGNKNNVPLRLYLELSNICNANCIFCGYSHDTRKKQIMNDDVFYKAIADFKEVNGKNVHLTTYAGDAFLDIKLVERIRYISEHDIPKLHLYTNGLLLYKINELELINSGLSGLSISSAPLIREVYERIYRNKNYDNLLVGLEKIMRSYKKHYPQNATLKGMTLEFRADRSLQECLETDDFLIYVKPHLFEKIRVSSINEFDAWAGVVDESVLLPGMKLARRNILIPLPCARLFSVQVRVDGSIRLCGCRFDYKDHCDRLLIGNINNETIREAFNSKYARSIILNWMKMKYPRVCKQCSWYYWFQS